MGVKSHVGFLRSDGAQQADAAADIVRHVDYMVERMGIDHVALGSDFDGDHALRAARRTGLPKLMDALRRRYDDDALRKIAHENWLRPATDLKDA